ncbi:MAG: nucleotidyltransferase [bacterium]|nr:nucleotidyltransferase [bacterium]
MAVGVIAEYNPFHNGHMYHLKKIKEMFPNEEIIAVISSSFTQRGEPSIINKWDKTDICLKAGIDLVIELPYVFSTESADYFSYGALTILEKLGVDKFVFGSETNDIGIFKKIVDIQLNNEDFDKLVKIYLKFGNNYPTALSLALKDLDGEVLTLPNDLLGISYVKIIKENNYKIKPFCIKRTSDYNSLSIDNNISSATAIRKALEEKKNVSSLVPDFVLEKFSELHFKEEYFKFLKYKIMLDDNLERYQTVDEGLGFKLKKEIISSTSYDELIEKIKSKRYTQNRINRMLNHILCDFTKEKKSKCQDLEYIRILGFNDKGQIFINKNKKKCDLPIISNFSKNKSVMMEQEFIATLVYASILDEKRKKELIEKEYKYHPKYKEKMNNE